MVSDALAASPRTGSATGGVESAAATSVTKVDRLLLPFGVESPESGKVRPLARLSIADIASTADSFRYIFGDGAGFDELADAFDELFDFGAGAFELWVRSTC